MTYTLSAVDEHGQNPHTITVLGGVSLYKALPVALVPIPGMPCYGDGPEYRAYGWPREDVPRVELSFAFCPCGTGHGVQEMDYPLIAR